MMQRPSRRTTRAPMLPRIGSTPRWERPFAPGLGREAAGQRLRVLGGGPAATRTSAARRGRGASGGDAGGILAGRFEDDSRAAGRRKRLQPKPATRARVRWAGAPGGGPADLPDRGVPLAPTTSVLWVLDCRPGRWPGSPPRQAAGVEPLAAQPPPCAIMCEQLEPGATLVTEREHPAPKQLGS